MIRSTTHRLYGDGDDHGDANSTGRGEGVSRYDGMGDGDGWIDIPGRSDQKTGIGGHSDDHDWFHKIQIG
tara:strand:+ start:187 stop:396 length:210 start_codon:yes stop_codon:yes gene_type:complete